LNVFDQMTNRREPPDFDLLIQQAKHGDQQALDNLLAHYRQYMVFLARTQVHDNLQAKLDASDIAQETCLQAFRSIEQFRGASSTEFAGWLRGVLGHVVAMQLRSFFGTQKRDARLEQSIDNRLASASGFLHSGLAADITSPSQNFARQEVFLKMASAMESLPDDYREVIILRHVDALPFAEIAKRMERSVDSVEKLWVRGLAKMRQSMGEG
jgi:RNA polymerase sigma-70 factor, ECF subfamily